MNSPEKFPLPDAGAFSSNTGKLDAAIEVRERRLRVIGTSVLLTLFVGLGLWSAYAPLDDVVSGCRHGLYIGPASWNHLGPVNKFPGLLFCLGASPQEEEELLGRCLCYFFMEK